MNNLNEYKLKIAKKALNEKNIYFVEFPNGQLQVDGVNYWSTKEKFYDPKTNYKDNGLNKFLNYIEKRMKNEWIQDNVIQSKRRY